MAADSITRLRVGDLQIVQASNGYRFSLDPVLLSHFAASAPARQVVDLGTGSGVIPLLLARLTGASSLIGLELQAEQVVRAQQSVELNGLQSRVEIRQGDVRQVRQLFPAGKADLVVTNPPYRKPGSGRIAPESERAAARHELAGGLSEFVAAAGWLLANRGRFVIIYLAERLPELFDLMLAEKIEPKRLRMIHPRSTEPARMVLVEGRKNVRPGLAVEAPLVIYRDSTDARDYSAEVSAMYGEVGPR